jgi:hypothetical protein
MSMAPFRVCHIYRHSDQGPHVATVFVQIGQAEFPFKVFERENGRGYIRGGVNMGQPAKRRLRAAVLAAAGYGGGQ